MHGKVLNCSRKGWRAVAPGLLAVMLAACQSGWVTLDGQRAASDARRAAESACDVAERLAELEAAEAERARRLREANSNAATMIAREDFDRRAREIRDALERCMRDRGFRPG